MKKYIYFVFFICMIMLNFVTIGLSKGVVFADMDVNKQEITIIINNFDKMSEEYKKLFWNLDLPMTIVTSNLEQFDNFSKRQDKQKLSILNDKNVKKVEIISQNPQEMRNLIYNSISIAKEYGKCLLVFNLTTDSVENGYYALLDSMTLFEKMNVQLSYFD